MAYVQVPVCSVIDRYRTILKDKVKFQFSGNRQVLGNTGEINRFFLFELVRERDIFLDFLKDTGLIKSQLNCLKCQGEMKLRGKSTLSDGFVFVCKNSITAEGGKRKKCEAQKSVRYGSWFTNSKLTLDEIFFLTYELLIGTKTNDIMSQYSFSSRTLADWRQFVNEIILEFVEASSEKIGGVGKIVEIDESKFGKRKYGRGHYVEGQWVFGGGG